MAPAPPVHTLPPNSPAPQAHTLPPLSPGDWAGFLVVFELLLAAGVAATSYGFAHYQRGTYMNPWTHLWGIFLSFLLLLCIAANWMLIGAGGMDALVVTGVAMAVLWWTDIIGFRLGVRRRTKVARLLATIPTFRVEAESPAADESSGHQFVVRSAHWHLRSASRHVTRVNHSDGRVTDHTESALLRDKQGASLVVLYDEATQDYAGADLLTLQFTHHRKLGDKHLVQAIWDAVCRAQLENLDHWRPGLCSEIERSLENNPNIERVRSQLACSITCDDAQNTTLNKLIWAALTVEGLAFLANGRNMKMLHALVREPLSIVDSNCWDVELFARKLGAFTREEISLSVVDPGLARIICTIAGGEIWGIRSVE